MVGSKLPFATLEAPLISYLTFELLNVLLIAFRLTLLAMGVATPIIMSASYFRLHYELQFEKMNQAVFAESSKFGAEAIGAFRTVTSLTLENMICQRYDVLLQDHVRKAFKKARFTTLLFSFSDSIALPCMALTFWYGVSTMGNIKTPWQVLLTVIEGSTSCAFRVQCHSILRCVHCNCSRLGRCWQFAEFWSEHGTSFSRSQQNPKLQNSQ